MAEHVLELVRYVGWFMFVVVDRAQDPISFFLISNQALQSQLLDELVHLVVGVGCGPIDGLLQLLHGAGRQLNLAAARLASLQRLRVVAVERETLQVGKLRRSAEWFDCQISRNLAQPIEIIGELEVAFRRRIDVDRAEHKNLRRSSGGQRLGNGLTTADRCDLVLTQSTGFLEIILQLNSRLSCAERYSSGDQ